MISVCNVRNNLCMLLRNFRREKMLGEMWAAVIKSINNLLRLACLRTRATNGDKAGVSRCSEGDHEGRICEMPQEYHSPSMYIAQIVYTLWRGIQQLSTYCKNCWRSTSQSHSSYIANLCVNLLVTANILFCLFSCTNMSCNNRCLFFRRLKINHESHGFILDPGTVANTNFVIYSRSSDGTNLLCNHLRDIIPPHC
jgi:hypothetical protein